jgi:hypothetical protein
MKNRKNHALVRYVLMLAIGVAGYLQRWEWTAIALGAVAIVSLAVQVHYVPPPEPRPGAKPYLSHEAARAAVVSVFVLTALARLLRTQLEHSGVTGFGPGLAVMAGGSLLWIGIVQAARTKWPPPQT